MTFPAPFLNRYISYPYQMPNHFWPYLNTQQLNASPLINSYPRLQYLHPLNQIYSQIPIKSYNFQQPLTISTPFIPQYSFQNVQKQVDLKKQEWRLIQNNKIQNKNKQKKEPVLIEISDEENHDQQEKKPECLTAPTIHNTEESITFKQKEVLQQKKKCHATQRQDQGHSLEQNIKQHQNRKVDKEKKICKFFVSKKIQKKCKDAGSSKVKRNIISERIAKKIQQQKGSYRLTKKQKSTLEITLLRETTNQILTGPQFQAKLPEFRLHNTDLIGKINSIRQDLLSRLYQQSEYDDQDD